MAENVYDYCVIPLQSALERQELGKRVTNLKIYSNSMYSIRWFLSRDIAITQRAEKAEVDFWLAGSYWLFLPRQKRYN